MGKFRDINPFMVLIAGSVALLGIYFYFLGQPGYRDRYLDASLLSGCYSGTGSVAKIERGKITIAGMLNGEANISRLSVSNGHFFFEIEPGLGVVRDSSNIKPSVNSYVPVVWRNDRVYEIDIVDYNNRLNRLMFYKCDHGLH